MDKDFLAGILIAFEIKTLHILSEKHLRTKTHRHWLGPLSIITVYHVHDSTGLIHKAPKGKN